MNEKLVAKKNLAVIFSLLCLFGFAKTTQARISLVKTISVGSLGGSLESNSQTNLIYFAGTDLRVISGMTNTVTATIPDVSQPLIAVNEKTNKVYVLRTVDIGEARIIEIDGSTNTTTQTNIFTDPNSTNDIAVNSSTNQLYLNIDNAIYAWDLVTRTNPKIITVGYLPRAIAVNERTSRIYVADYGPESDPRSHVTVIDGNANSRSASIDLAPIVSNPTPSTLPPLQIAVNEITSRIYVTGSANPSVSVINGATNQVVARLSEPTNSRDVAVNSSRNVYYVTTSDGKISAFDGVTDQVIDTQQVSTPTQSVFFTDVTVNNRTNLIYAAATVSQGTQTQGLVYVFRDDFDPTNDTTAPAVSLSSPSNGAKLTTFPAITGMVQDNVGGSGIGRVALFIRRSSDGKYFSGRNYSTSLVELPSRLNGSTFMPDFALPSGVNLRADTYFVTAVAIDRAQPRDNRRSVTVSIRIIDATAPVVAFTYPTNGQQLSQLTKISGTLTDDVGGVGPSRVLVQIRRVSDGKYFDGTRWTASAVALPTRLIGTGRAVAFELNTAYPPAQSGTDIFRITAVGFDRSFNRSVAQTIEVRVGTVTTAT